MDAEKGEEPADGGLDAVPQRLGVIRHGGRRRVEGAQHGQRAPGAAAGGVDRHLGGGLQQQSTNFSGSRHFNFRVMGGGGGTLRVTDQVRMTGGMRYLHISDAGIEGGGGGFDGFMFYAGTMFSF